MRRPQVFEQRRFAEPEHEHRQVRIATAGTEHQKPEGLRVATPAERRVHEKPEGFRVGLVPRHQPAPQVRIFRKRYAPTTVMSTAQPTMTARLTRGWICAVPERP